jgi:hypothetical protein
MRAATRALGLALQGLLARLVEALDLEVALRVPVDDRLEVTVLGTVAGEDDAAIALE